MMSSIEKITGKAKFEADPATYNYPRKGPNNKVKEIDLRIWENLYIESLKVLGKWDQFHDIARALQVNAEIPNVEMIIEYYWNAKNWSALSQYEYILRRSDSIKHRMMLIYLSIKH